MEEELSELISIARCAANAGAEAHRHAIEKGSFRIDTKASPFDLVTEIDRHSEQEIVSTIRAARPNDGIISEEGANFPGASRVRWVLDPLDGTTNFVHRYPAHSVAVGVEIDGKRVIGVVHDTFSNRVYAGIVGKGADCDGKPITVRQEQILSQALVGTGFLPNKTARREQAGLLREILPHVRDIRRSGCPSLDICGVASGVLDAFYEFGLGPWDISAASAIAEAAGASVLLFNSRRLPDPLLVVANAGLSAALVTLLTEAGAIDLVSSEP